MANHLRYAGADPDLQRRVLIDIVRSQPHLMHILEGMQALALPDPLLGSGAIYNTVWNVLTAREPLTGIKDADVVYFDAGDLSYEAEDAVIRRAAAYFAASPLPVEVRNQARVHLWFPQKFGTSYPQLQCSADMMLNFASRTHVVAVRLEDDGGMSVHAPFGLDDIFAFRVTPNVRLDNARTHADKAARALGIWPELTVVPWPA
ncbi:MAG: nucleotidyltransferase family protein, partial [Devosia sp.]|nr:nucleotidyltransferase family protein [Devosia sp.]